MLTKLSFVLPRLIVHGQPSGGLELNVTEFGKQSEFDPDAFNRLFPMFEDVNRSDVALTNVSQTPTWPTNQMAE